MSVFPTQSAPDFAPLQPPPAWVKVIGIISIVLGSLGLICNCFGVVGAVAAPAIMQNLPPEAQVPPDAMPGPANIALAAIAFVLSIILLTAGILLLKHVPVSKALHLVWAGLSIPITIAGILLQLKVQAATASFQRDMGIVAPPGQQFGQIIGLGCGAVLGLAYPIFLLVWFAAMGKKVPPRANFPAA